MEHFATCSRCDYEEDYKPNAADYFYHGLSKKFKYPIIKFAWCNDCKEFVPVQMGVNIERVKEKIEIIRKQIVKEGKRIFKTSRTKEKIKSLEEELNNYITLQTITNGQSTTTACCNCNSTNVVFKNIDTEIWRCPKCKMGLLILKEKEDDILYRRGEIFITPQERGNYIHNFMEKMIFCALDIINNESLFYYIKFNSNELSAELSTELFGNIMKPISLIDRLALIYAYLIKFLKPPLQKVLFVQLLTQHLIKSEIEKEGNRNLIIDRLNDKIKYFISEIEIEMSCSMFIPSAIIITLRNPQKPSTREIVGIEPVDALNEWKIISDTIKGYFGHDY